MSEPEVRRVPVAPGIALAVRRWPGSAEDAVPFLLVHGLASNARMWDGVAEALARAGHEVVAVDLRGHGQSDKPDDGYDFATVAGDLRRVAETLGLERPVVAGQSWGGNVAVDLAARYPGLARGVAGIDGGAIDLQARFPGWDDAAVRLAPPALAGTPLAEFEARFRATHPDWPESGAQGMLANFETLPDGTIAPWLTRPRHMAILRALLEQRPLATLAEVEVPVLLVGAMGDAGEAEPAKRAELEQAETALANGRVVWMAGDHDLHAQRPEAVAGLLREAVASGFFG